MPTKERSSDFLAVSATVSSALSADPGIFTAPAAPMDSSTMPTPESVNIETVAYPKTVPIGVLSTITSEIRSNNILRCERESKKAVLENYCVRSYSVVETILIIQCHNSE